MRSKELDNKELSFKNLTNLEEWRLKRLKQKIMKSPSYWRNLMSLEEELEQLDDEHRLLLARAGRIKFKELTGR